MHNLALSLAQKKNIVISGSDDAIFEPSKTRLSEAGLLPEKEGWFEEKINSDLDAVILGMHAKKEESRLLPDLRLDLIESLFREYLK